MNKMHRYVAKCNRKAPTNHKQPYTVFSPHAGPAPLASDALIKSALDPSAEVPSQREAESPPRTPLSGGPPRGGGTGQYSVLESFIHIMSIDPGIRNCGLRVEQRRLLDNVLVDVKTVIMVRINFNEEDSQGERKDSGTVTLDTSYYTRSADILDQFIPYAIQCQYILIESQLPINYSMVRMSQHLITYLCVGVKNRGYRPLIIEIDPHLKSRLLNAPTKMKKPELKKWCRQKALEVLLARGDNVGHDAILKVGKGDDMGDTVCQCEAWWIILCGQLHAPPLPHFSGSKLETRHIGALPQDVGRARGGSPIEGASRVSEAPGSMPELVVKFPGLNIGPPHLEAGLEGIEAPLTISGLNVPPPLRGEVDSSPDSQVRSVGSEITAEIASTGRTRLRIRSTNISSINESSIAFQPSIKLRISKPRVPDC